MEIRTKFDIGDTLFVLSGGKVVSSKIKHISCNVASTSNSLEGNMPEISYRLEHEYYMSCDYYKTNITVPEKLAFGSKQELLNSL